MKHLVKLSLLLATMTEASYCEPSRHDQDGPGLMRDLQAVREPFQVPALPSVSADARNQLSHHLQNTDFETTNPDGTPAYWNMFREAFIDHDATLAYSGERSVRSSFLFGWGQDLLPLVSPYQTFAIAGQANLEFDWARAGIRGAYFRENGEFLKELNGLSPVSAPAGSYGEFWATQKVPEGAARLSLFLRGQAAVEWLRFDNLSTFSEQLRFSEPDTEEGWTVTGGASVSADTIELPPGASAWQRVAVGSENQAYFVWGCYTASGDANLAVSEQWLPRDASETTATTSTTHMLSSAGVFLSDPGRLAGKASGQARVLIDNSGPSAVAVSALLRGFAKVEPAVLTVGPASPDGTLKLTAALPGHLTSATIEILPQSGTPMPVTAVNLLGTSVRAEWEPTGVPGGSYIGRFTFQSADGETVTVDRTFQVIREDSEPAVIAPLPQSNFTRGIWLFATGSAASTMQMFEQLRLDGFDFAVVLTTLPRLPDVRLAAEAHNVPFVVFAPEAVDVFRAYEYRSWFSKADYIATIKQMFAPVADSEMFRGIYVVDEPSRPEELIPLEKIFLSLAQDGTLGQPYTVFIDSVSSAAIASVQPPLVMIDSYPYDLQTGRDGTTELLSRIPLMNQQVRDFTALGRHTWFLPQGFISRLNSDAYYPAPPSMFSAQLGAIVMAGAKGTLPFFYSTEGGTMEGLRWPGLTPTPKLEPYVRFNKVIDRIGPLLMQLDVPDVRTDAPFPLAVSTAVGPGGVNYVFALNADEDTTHTLRLDLEIDVQAPLLDLVTERLLTANSEGHWEVSLPPGDWALISIGANAVAGLSAAPAPPDPPLSTIDLPLTHQFTVTGINDIRLPVRELEFNAAGDAIAASVPFIYAPSPPQVYYLESSGTATRESGPFTWLAEKTGVTEDGLYAVASPLLGVELYPPGGFDGAPVASFKGYAGGGHDVLRAGDTTWLTIDIGIRTLQQTEAGLSSTAVGWSNRGANLDLFGPFSDGSVSMVVVNHGISNVKPGHLHEFAHRYEILNNVDRNAAMNSNNLLAAPRHQRGVALFQLSSTGEPSLVANIATDAMDACAVSWVYDNLLAVADGYKSVRFYWILNNQATLVGTWRPPLPDYFYMLSMDVAEGRIAVGCHDGRVVVADTSNLEQPSSVVGDWVLYE